MEGINIYELERDLKGVSAMLSLDMLEQRVKRVKERIYYRMPISEYLDAVGHLVTKKY